MNTWLLIDCTDVYLKGANVGHQKCKHLFVNNLKSQINDLLEIQLLQQNLFPMFPFTLQPTYRNLNNFIKQHILGLLKLKHEVLKDKE